MSKGGVQGTSVRLPKLALDAYVGDLPVSRPVQARELTKREHRLG